MIERPVVDLPQPRRPTRAQNRCDTRGRERVSVQPWIRRRSKLSERTADLLDLRIPIDIAAPRPALPSVPVNEEPTCRPV